jgi:LmbE family N-acetylglucosaminyl deacetylase
MPALFTDVPRRVLAIYAHPDDPEVSCGGTLAAWARAGSEVHVVVAACGEKGTRHPDADPTALARQREEETAAAATVLGVTGVERLGIPDGEVENTPELRRRLVEIVRRLQPDVVLAPDPTAAFFGDSYVNHVDHRHLGWAALDAVAPAAASPLYFPDTGPAHQVATVLLSGSLTPDVWVDIEASLDAKVGALACHLSQVGDGSGDWLGAFVRERAESEGRRAGIPYAEGFRRLRLG